MRTVRAKRSPTIAGAHLIAGEWNRGRADDEIASFDVDGSKVCSAPIADANCVDAAVSAACASFEQSGWKDRPARERAALLFRVADAMEERVEELATVVSREVGMPIGLARSEEVRGAADKLRYFGSVARAIEGRVNGTLPPHLLDVTVPQAIGVCALITPWNNPLEQPVRQLGPALAAGCSVVIKPSEETPASTQALVEILADDPDLPPGVVNLVHGPGDPTGEALAAHGDVRKVAFTGSSATARRVQELASIGLKRVSLECGGKSPALVFSDCALEKCLDALAAGAFLYSGQSCSAATRVIAERQVYDAVVEGLVARAERLSVGHPLDPQTVIGPLISERHAARVGRFLSTVEGAGGTFATGGVLDGRYLAPTVVTGVDPRSEIATEEVFGPVTCVFAVDSEDEAIRLANASRFGLQAAVWTSDLERSICVARRLQYGDVWINTYYIRNAETPFGGWKESGVGRELGLAGLDEYVAYQRIAFDVQPNYHFVLTHKDDSGREN
jgi:acyl-CoA reductase-like NAD-dependent aldehyde dehydrogenase